MPILTLAKTDWMVNKTDWLDDSWNKPIPEKKSQCSPSIIDKVRCFVDCWFSNNTTDYYFRDDTTCVCKENRGEFKLHVSRLWKACE